MRHRHQVPHRPDGALAPGGVRGFSLAEAGQEPRPGEQEQRAAENDLVEGGGRSPGEPQAVSEATQSRPHRPAGPSRPAPRPGLWWRAGGNGAENAAPGSPVPPRGRPAPGRAWRVARHPRGTRRPRPSGERWRAGPSGAASRPSALRSRRSARTTTRSASGRGPGRADVRPTRSSASRPGRQRLRWRREAFPVPPSSPVRRPPETKGSP